MHYYNSKLKPFARELRKGMTLPEKRLWSRIRRKQINNLQFYRQKVLGHYIVDFYCPVAKLVIEVDGGHHFLPENMFYDQERTNYLESLGLRVIRFTNREVMANIDGVIEQITITITKKRD